MRGGGSHRATGGLLALTLVLLGPLGACESRGREPDAAARSQRPASSGSAAPTGVTLNAFLVRLASAVREGRSGVSAGEVLDAAATPSAERTLRMLSANVRRLGIVDLSLRYAGHTSASQEARTVDVRVSWRTAGAGPHRSSLLVPFLLTAGEPLLFVGIRPELGRPAPLWMLSPLVVRRHRRALVLVASRSPRASSGIGQLRRVADDYLAMADNAVRDVRSVLPHWAGPLVVEVPSTQAQMARRLGARHHDNDAFAALTTTADGSAHKGAPAHVVVNPRVFPRLDATAAQIVISHESTHVATSAPVSAAPLWLIEGFADYVALRRVDLPLSVTAGQVLAQVAAGRGPSRLPVRGSFDSSNPRLGAAYEASWLACRLIARRYGEGRLVELYDAVDSGTPAPRAFRTTLRTTPASVTRRWLAYLERTAGARVAG